MKIEDDFNKDFCFVLDKKESDFYQNDVISKNSKVMKVASMMKNEK